MADWKHTIDLRTVWASGICSDIATCLEKQLRTLHKNHFGDDEELESLADELHAISFDGTASATELDCVLDAVFDWADSNLVWIST